MPYFLELAATLIIGLFAGVITYIFFRKQHLTFWAFLAGIAPDWPRIFLSPLGVTNLENLLFLTHTVGILLFPLALVIVDITLIELGMTSLLRPFNSYLPKKIQSLVNLEKSVASLEKKGFIPMPTKIRLVYLIGVLAGGLKLVLDFAISYLIR